MIRFDDVTKTYMRGQRPAVENIEQDRTCTAVEQEIEETEDEVDVSE